MVAQYEVAAQARPRRLSAGLAETVFRVGDSFLSACLPDELAAEVGGSTTLHSWSRTTPRPSWSPRKT